MLPPRKEVQLEGLRFTLPSAWERRLVATATYRGGEGPLTFGLEHARLMARPWTEPVRTGDEQWTYVESGAATEEFGRRLAEALGEVLKAVDPHAGTLKGEPVIDTDVELWLGTWTETLGDLQCFAAAFRDPADSTGWTLAAALPRWPESDAEAWFDDLMNSVRLGPPEPKPFSF
ncbi:MAG: hypothetical protein AAF938_21950 [Myxococcota bacterium]